MRILTLAAFAVLSVQHGTNSDGGEKFLTYTRHHDMDPGALSSVGVGAPNVSCCGTVCGDGLNNVNEILADSIEIGREWDGASNLTLHIHTVPSDGDPFAAGEDVDFDVEWRSLDPTSETGKTGDAALDTGTYTQSGAGAECEINVISISIPYTGGNQPLTAGDDLSFKFFRDTTSEASGYSSDIIVYKAEIFYDADKLATH